MTFIVMAASALIAWIAQYLNARKVYSTAIVKVVCAAVGITMYAIVKTPTAWTGQPFLSWLDDAWVWALALPGAASLIGINAAYKTDSR